MRLCFEKVDLGAQDAALFQDVMNALLEARSESEAQGRLEEARVWFDKWRPLETLDLAWGSGRVAILEQLVESKNAVVMAMTEEMAQTICNLADDSPSVPLIEAFYYGMSLADLKEIATASTKARLEREDKKGS
jgi:hypothetical protein